MTTSLDWREIALRLLMTVIAGALIGLDRGERGRPVGVRTTLLVALAAALAMIQTNLLLATAGKTHDSYVTLDLMRLPLGILSGMGFIGGGAILKRGKLVLGVTTAATLWFVTVLGLCFGGGQIALGLAGLAIGLVVLGGLKRLERKLPQERQATLIVVVGPGGPTTDALRSSIMAEGFRIATSSVTYDNTRGLRKHCCELRWRDRPSESHPPPLPDTLAGCAGVSKVRWIPRGAPVAF